VEVPRLDVNFFEESFVRDPFPWYEEIRTKGRVVWNDTLNAWMVPGYRDCTTVVSDSGDRFDMTARDPMYMGPDAPYYFGFDDLNMMAVSGIEHTRLRHFFAPMFTRSEIAKWERRVAEVTDQLLAPLADGVEDYDLIADFTTIPTIIVAEMLGIPKEHHGDFRRWSHSIASNQAGNGHESTTGRAEMRRAGEELNAYLREEIERHRREELDDLFSVMLQTDGDVSEAEMRSTAVLMMIAGYDTTAKAMASCLVALERHPDQRALVAEDPSLIPAAIEEVLRCECVVHGTVRRVANDTVLADTPLAADEQVYVLYAAANRDPERWPDPQRFDVRREPKANLGFGFGPHLCLGAHLARLEIRVVLERLLRIAPEYRLRDVDYGKAFIVRGPERGFLDVAV
jgi:cytochrome P450